MNVTKKDTLTIYWRAVRNHKPSLTCAVIGVVAGAIVSTIHPIFYKKLFDLLARPESPATLYPQLLEVFFILLAFACANWALHRIADFGNNIFLTSVKADIKERAFSALLHHSYAFFTNSFAGALVRRVHRLSSDGFEVFADKLLWTLLPLGVQLVGIAIVLSLNLPVFAVVFVVWFVLFACVQISLSLWKMRYDKIRAERDTESTAILSDALTNHTTMQLFARKKYEFKKFRDINQSLRRMMLFTWNLSAVIDAVQFVLFLVIEFVVLYLALGAWRDGHITIGTFVLVESYMIQIFGRLWDFGRAVRSIFTSFADAKEMVEIILQPIDVTDIPNARPLSLTNGEIVFDHTSFSYQKTRKVLDSLSLTVRGGERVALVGHSGAGKSTIVKLLLRLHDLESGKILIDGQNIQKVTQDSLRASIAFVPQEPLLFHRTLLENIRYGRLDTSDDDVYAAARLAHCDEFIRDLPDEYDTLVGERGVKLSVGERQRVAIARAILKNAKILILDEATSSLDSESEMMIQDALATLMKGKTVIAIAHRLSTIKQMDRILVVDEGKLIEEGTHGSLIKKRGSLYGKLWKLQSGGFLA